MDIRAAYEKFADPRAKYMGHEIFDGGISITYQVDGYPTPSKACHPVTGAVGTRTAIEAAEAIGKWVLSDVRAA